MEPQNFGFSPAVVGTDLFTHIRNMFPVTIPAMLIALGVYLYTGMQFSGGVIDQASLSLTVETLGQSFNMDGMRREPLRFSTGSAGTAGSCKPISPDR